MKLFNKIRSLSRKGKLAVAVLAISVGVAVPFAVQAEFYPDRPTFDYNKSTGGDCNDPNNPAAQGGRCGSMNGPVFNSFINTPSYGDERAFVDARRSDQTAAGSYKNVLPDVTKGSKEIVVRMYVHNNANSYTNCLPAHLNDQGVCTQIDNDAKGIAKNTKVRLALPNVEGNALRAVGYISADNATPGTVEDTVDFTSTENFTVAYKPGSAIIYSNGPVNGQHLSDSIVTTGAPIGYDALNGILPGCFQYESVVQVTLTVTPKPATNMQLAKEVKKVGDSNWQKVVDTKPGDEVQWLLTTKNIGNADLTNVSVRDILPPHVQLVPNTVRVVDASQDTKQQDAPLFGNGFNLGTYPSGGGRYVIFNTKVLGDFDQCDTRVRNIAKAKSDQLPNEISDTADVIITKTNCNPTPQTPVYSCDALTATLGTNRNTHFDTKATAINGASITLYQYDFGDGSQALVTDKASVDHAYAKDGQYAARVKVQVAVDGTSKWVDSDKCATAVSYTTPPTTPPTSTTPGKPATLVNTGAGDVAGIFAAVTIAGAFLHRVVLGRRLSRQ